VAGGLARTARSSARPLATKETKAIASARLKNDKVHLAFSDWPTIFPNAGSAIALIDRLIHHAEILTVEGESYRRRATELTRKTPRAKASS
jgi:IstB-like ATP binding protein